MLNNQRLFETISPCSSIMGDIDHSSLQAVNLNINGFGQQCRGNLAFLEKFKKQVLEMESGFDAGWGSNAKLNSYFYRYEKDVLAGHLLSLQAKNKREGKAS